MHRSKIEWVDDVWNPITGCEYNCQYCYARKHSVRFTGNIQKNLVSLQYEKNGELYILESPFIAETGSILNYPFGFLPTYHKYRLDYPERRKNGNNILVGEFGEMFGDWIPNMWLKEVFEACKQHSQHNYLFLTKNPSRYKELYEKDILVIDKNFWYGSSVISTEKLDISSKINTFICIEPIREAFKPPKDNIRLADWIIVGAESGNNYEKIIPEKKWIDDIVDYAKKAEIPVFIKESLREIMKDDMKQEYPPQLLKKEISLKVKERMEGNCCSCNSHMQKNQMIALCARFQRGEPPKQYAHICQNCFITMCKNYNITPPKKGEK